MKRIEEISVFGEYKQTENRVTAAFLQICKVGGEDFIRFLTNKLKIQLPSSEIEIYSQVKSSKNETVPDGLLASNFSFKLFIESKIKSNAIDEKQLEGHKTKTKDNFLLYLTPDDTKPKILGEISWANWLTINNTFNDYLQTSQNENMHLLEFLIQNFSTLLGNLNLLGIKNNWDLNNLNNEEVLIVAGSWAESIALNYNYYICQNNRSFKPAHYLAFFNNDQIRYLFEIKAQKNNFNLLQREIGYEFNEYLREVEPSYESEDLRQVFSLNFIQDIGPIINDKIDRNGKRCPYTYGQPRYTTLEKLKKATKTSEL